MDTGKLLQIIKDTQDEEAIAQTQTLLTNILNYIAQATSTAVEDINTEKQKIYVATVEQSPLSKYAVSDYDALERLKLTSLFGPGLYQRLEEHLKAPSYEVDKLLQQLISERSTAISTLSSLQTNLTHFELKTRELDGDNYEIGFSLPDNYLDISKTKEALGDFELVLHSLADATDDQQPLRIKYVSNGCIELYIQAGQDLANNFGTLLDYAIRIYTAVKMFQDIKKMVSNFKATRKKAVEKETDEQQKEQVEKLIDEMTKAIKIPDDKKVEFAGRFKKFLKHMEAGVGAEVRTPKIPEPVEPEETAPKAEKDSYKKSLKNYENKISIDGKNREIFILQQNNFYGLDTKFLEAPVEEPTEAQ